MNDAPRHPTSTKRTAARRSWWMWLAGGLIAVALATIGGVGSWQRARLQAQLERVRAAGEPLTHAELEAFYLPPPPDQDATTLWLNGFAALDKAQSTDEEAFRNLPFVGEGDPPLPGAPFPDIELAERYLAARSEALRLFRDAGTRGGAARFPLIESPAPDSAMSEQLLGAIADADRTLQLQILVQAQHGDNASVALCLDTHLALAISLNAFPNTIAALRQFAVIRSCIERMIPLVPTERLSDDTLAQIQQRLRLLAIDQGRRAVICGDRINILRSLSEEVSEYGFPGLRGFIWNRVQVSFFELMAECVEIAQAPWPAALDKMDQLDDRLTSSKSRLDAFARLLWSTTQIYFEAAGTAMARVRAADAALAVERYRRQRGKLPESLAEVVPDYLPNPPVDPFSGAALCYKIRDQGFVVYSVGADRTDDGGYEEERRSGTPDVVVAVCPAVR